MQQRPRKNTLISRSGGAHFQGKTRKLEPVFEASDDEVSERPKEDRDEPIPRECSPLYLDYDGSSHTPPWTHDTRTGNEELSKTKTNASTGGMGDSGEQPKNKPSKTTISDA